MRRGAGVGAARDQKKTGTAGAAAEISPGRAGPREACTAFPPHHVTRSPGRAKQLLLFRVHLRQASPRRGRSDLIGAGLPCAPAGDGAGNPKAAARAPGRPWPFFATPS